MPCIFGSDIWAILCVIVGKINNMMLCEKKNHVIMCLRGINIEIVMNGNYM